MFIAFLKKILSLVGLEHTPNVEKSFKNICWLLLDNAIRLILGLFVTSYMARSWGPDNFGIFNYALAFVALFSLFATLGLNEVVVRSVLTDEQNKLQILSTAFVLRLMTGLLAFAGCFVAISLFNPPVEGVSVLVVIIASGLVFQAFDVIDSYFQSQLQSKYTILAKNSVFVLLSLIKLCCIFIKAPLIVFAWVALVEIVMGSIGLLIVFWRLHPELIGFKFDQKTASCLIKSCWPIWGAGIAVMINMRIDQVLLLHYKGQHALGVYSAAVRLSEIWYVLGAVIITSTFPVIIKLKSENEKIYRFKLKQLYLILKVVGFSASVMTIVFSKQIIHLLFGSEYMDAVPLVLVHVLSVAIVYMGGASTYVLVAEGMQGYHFLRMVFACVIHVILCLGLIPFWGAMGAAVATLISYALGVYSILLFKSTRRFL